jgi:hypothetical protein
LAIVFSLHSGITDYTAGPAYVKGTRIAAAAQPAGHESSSWRVELGTWCVGCGAVGATRVEHASDADIRLTLALAAATFWDCTRHKMYTLWDEPRPIM